MMLIFALVSVLMSAYGVYRWWRDQQRVDALAAFCLSKGWDFALYDASLTARWTGEPFFEGMKRTARDVVRGTVPRTTNTSTGNWPFVAFDYSYVTESSDGRGTRQRTTHRYAVCAVTLPTWLPALTLTPENVMSRLGHTLVGGDIELESEEFNRKYRVVSPDPKFASDVLPPRTMQMLIARSPLHIRVEGRDVLCWEQGTTTPTTLLPRLATLVDFAAGIPAFVWHDYGASSDSAARG